MPHPRLHRRATRPTRRQTTADLTPVLTHGLQQISAHLPDAQWLGEGQLQLTLPSPTGPLTYLAQVHPNNLLSLRGPGYLKFFRTAAALRRATLDLTRPEWWPRRAVIPPGDTYCYQPGSDAPTQLIALGPLLFPDAPRDERGAALVNAPGLCPHLRVDPFAQGGLGQGHCLLTGDRDHTDADLLMDLVRSHRCPGRLETA